MSYEAPGRVEPLTDQLADAWNAVIAEAYKGRRKLHSRFFSLEPTELNGPEVVSVTWPADPLEPTFCTDGESVRSLCDLGDRGRHALHNEYCEYAVAYGFDDRGRRRPRRVQFTTELAEYWLVLATLDPDRLLAAVADVLGEEPSWPELYGVANPHRLGEGERRLRFAATMAGHGEHACLKDAEVPLHPTGRLNRENAIFMTHPINGLDDLLYIVLFGARPVIVREPGGGHRPARRDEIFAKQQRLACRHADPAAAMSAHRAVLDGKALSFANPLGVYLHPFNTELLQVGEQPIPAAWIRWSRGEEGMHQRLVFGPGDEEDVFLDEVEVLLGQERQRLTGGYQLLRLLEVGPRLAVGATEPPSEEELKETEPGASIECRKTCVCAAVSELEAERRAAADAPSQAASGA